MFLDKIKTIEELAEIIKKEKENGKKVALSHGCFDLLHIGHIKHFNGAKKNADVLVVTVTPDRFVNKGPGRPVFSEGLRLEALANLEMVDYVGLNDGPDAVSLIKRLCPNFYVKGDEYKNLDSPGGKRKAEKEAIENCGGQMIFTSEATFSSSSLINNNFDYLSPEVSRFLNQIRKNYTKDQINEFLEKIGSLKVLVIGDPIIDEYTYCKTVGTISKFPAISAIYDNTLKMAGGALALARHLAEFAKSVDYIGIAGGKDQEVLFMKEKLDEMNIRSELVIAPDRYSTLKRRFVSGNYPSTLEIDKNLPDDKSYKLFEIAFMNDLLIDKETEDKICAVLENKIKENDLVILADFGHGMITPKIAKIIAERANYWSLNAQTNSTNYGFNFITKYTHVY